jgi:hypothetical protein
MTHLDFTPYLAKLDYTSAFTRTSRLRTACSWAAKSIVLPGLLLCSTAINSQAKQRPVQVTAKAGTTNSVTQPAPLTLCNTQLTTTVTNATCSSTGAINLMVAGGTAPYSYAWTGPDGFRASTEDVSGLTAGTYSVTVTDAAQCTATQQATVAVTGDTTPPVLLGAGFIVTLVNGTTTILADDVDYGSYDDCSGVASMSVSPRTFTCANIGSNNVIFTVTDNAGNSASQTVTIEVVADATCVALATTSATKTDELVVYPNPATERTTLSFLAQQAGAAQVVIYNSLGQVVTTLFNGTVKAQQQYSFSLESQKLPAGVYSCQLRTAGHTQFTRLIVK